MAAETDGFALKGPSPGVPETDGFTQLRGAVRSLVDELVREGVLPKEKADAVVERAMQRARRETAVTGGGTTPQVADEGTEPPAGSLRIPYIPEPVKQEIIEQIRTSVRQDVVQDVLKQAKEERWGIPDAFPAWVNRISFFGDLRLRAQINNFADDNASNYYLNIQRINQRRFDSGGGEDNLNTTEDQRNMRLQARVGLLAKVSESVNAIVRVSTGSTNNPVSTNHTFSNGFSSGQVVLDQGYLRYQSKEKSSTLWGGRLPNPFLTTDLVWDNDVNFDGVAATFRRSSGNSTVPASTGFQPFLTLGAFPLQTPDRGRDDKWLYATQVGFDWGFGRSRLSIGAAYYSFSNIVGQANTFNDNSLDYTAPQFVQKGNTMYLIDDPLEPGRPLYGLAAEFREVDLIASLDIGAFGANHVILTAHYVKNLGFDLQEVRNRIIDSPNTEPFPLDEIGEDATGYSVKLTVGAPKLQNRGEWQTSWTYRYLGRDAVVDAYTDSDFHLGGTDAKGWILGASYAMANNTWISLRYLTSDAIKGAPFSVDTWQLDFNARF